MTESNAVLHNISDLLSENSTTYEYHTVPEWIYDFVAYWELMVAIIGTPMNLFVIFIWSTLASHSANRRFCQSKNRWFILSMTCGDLIFASVHAPMMYGWYSDSIEMSTYPPCYITYGSTHLSTTVSSISLLLLNVDKFIYLHWPLHYHSIMSTRRVIGLTIGAWVIAITWMLIFLFGPFMQRHPQCNWVAQHHHFYVAFLIVFFLMPVLLSTATSLYIATVAIRASLQEAASQATYGGSCLNVSNGEFRSHSNTITEETACNWPPAPPHPQNGQPKSVVNSIKPWRTITFVFSTTIWSTITYLPYRISFIVFTATQIQLTWHYPLFALMVIYAAGNPFITIFTQPPYRRRAKDVFQNARIVIKRLWSRREKR